MKAIIFAGGVGTRLWPLSRKNSPKQFEKIISNSSMLQLAVERLLSQFKAEDIYITTGKQYEETVNEQLPFIPRGNIIVEPATRDVGPAVGLVSALFVKKHPNEPIAILWGSDHLVREKQLFNKVLQLAGKIIKKHNKRIIFVGQKPRFASQNLGWIEFGSRIGKSQGINLYEFKGFKYRPGLKTAEKFFKDRCHAWNLGYFVTTPFFLWNLFKQFAPEIYKKLEIIQNSVDTDRYQAVLEKVYPTIEKISFDNAVLEKLDPHLALVISENLGWSDVGAWEALQEALTHYPEDNVKKGKVYLADSKGSLVYNFDKEKLVVGIDLEDNIIVNTHDVILITKKDSVPKIKELVKSFEGTEYEKLT